MAETALGAVRVLRRDARAGAVHHADERGAWATSDREILFQAPGEESWAAIGRFPFAFPRDLAGPSRLAKRAMRADQSNLFPARGGALLGVRAGTAYAIERGSARPLFALRGDCALRAGIAESVTGNLYLGEYFRNPGRGPVRIWRVAGDLGAFEVAHEFPAGSVRHVHGVRRDPFVENRLWAATGDEDGECFLFVTDDEFRSLRRLGDGTQLWRAVALLFTEREVLWLTDAPGETNRVVALDRGSLRPAVRGEIEGPVWYAARTSDGAFLAATAVEPGAGVRTDRATLLVSADGARWEGRLSFRKDRWPVRPFKAGVLSFPSGRFASDRFWISGEGLEGLDGASLLGSIEASPGPEARAR